jgi:O-antigen ligase
LHINSDHLTTKVYQYLLISLAFLLPLSVAAANLLIGIIVVFWSLSGNYAAKFHQIKKNKVVLSSIIFFMLHVIGLIWTENLQWGMVVVKKMWYFLLLFPILYTIVREKYIIYYVNAFLLAIFLTVFLSYLVWFGLIEPFKNATILNPTPFMSHISYNPILAFALYLVGHRLIFQKNDKVRVFLYSFLFFAMSFNMFITAGRAGQIVYFLLLGFLLFQYFNKEKLKALIGVIIIFPVIFLIAFNSSDLFHDRVKIAYKDAIYFDKNSSVGRRMTLAINSWQLVKMNPIIGVGTGDFPNEYLKVNKDNIHWLLSHEKPHNPHNMYLLILCQLGLLGLVSMLTIFYYQFKFSLNSPNNLIRDVGLFMPSMFLVIMMSDSYLLGHYTTLLFIFFSSFIYNDFKNNRSSLI